MNDSCSAPAIEMPRYKSHKTIWALKIKSVEGDTITPADEGYATFMAPPGYMEKHKPEAGGYYVVYADGYASFSPAKAFEEGYARIERGRPGQFRKKPVVINAAQWFKNGDHPDDYAADHQGLEGGELRTFTGAERKAQDWEGGVVRYYRHPDVPGSKPCEQCGKPHHVHGWIDTLEQGHRVCPGDWILTGVKGERYPCKPDIFAATYDPA